MVISMKFAVIGNTCIINPENKSSGHLNIKLKILRKFYKTPFLYKILMADLFEVFNLVDLTLMFCSKAVIIFIIAFNS